MLYITGTHSIILYNPNNPELFIFLTQLVRPAITPLCSWPRVGEEALITASPVVFSLSPADLFVCRGQAAWGGRGPGQIR